jgi:hypothetical protein
MLVMNCILLSAHVGWYFNFKNMHDMNNTVRSESRCALGLRYVDLVVSIEVAVAVCCCFIVFRF